MESNQLPTVVPEDMRVTPPKDSHPRLIDLQPGDICCVATSALHVGTDWRAWLNPNAIRLPMDTPYRSQTDVLVVRRCPENKGFLVQINTAIKLKVNLTGHDYGESKFLPVTRFVTCA